jgi:hypothetical protein
MSVYSEVSTNCPSLVPLMAVLIGLVTVLDGPRFQSRRQLRGALGFETRALGAAVLGKQHPSVLVKIRCPPLRYGMAGWSFSVKSNGVGFGLRW